MFANTTAKIDCADRVHHSTWSIRSEPATTGNRLVLTWRLAALDRVGLMSPLRAWAKREQQLIWITIAILLMVLAMLDPVIAFLTQLPHRVLLPVWKWIDDKAEVIVAAASLFVAYRAFRTSQETSKAQHKHNQLSVTPLADIPFGNFETNLFVSLVNNGTGPMIIKSITVIGAANPSEPLIKAMPDLPPDDLVTLTYFASDPTGRSIRAGGGGLRLLQLRYNGEKEFKNRFAPSRDKIRAALGPLTLRVEYKDIYEKEFETERSLGYFASELPNRSPPPSDAA
jgi:hypothetical protein